MRLVVVLLLGLILAVLLIGYFAGREEVPPGWIGLRVSNTGETREIGPGHTWRLPGSSAVLLYPAEPETLLFPSPALTTYRLFDRDGKEVPARFLVRYSVRRGEAGELYRETGVRHAQDLRDRVEEQLRQRARPLTRATTLAAWEQDQGRSLARSLGEAVGIRGLQISVQSRAGSDAIRVLVVGVDAGDWLVIDPLLEAGRLPHLASLIQRGVRADLHSLKPMLSPLLWTTIATGTTPDRHGILDFLTPHPQTGKMVPVSSTLRREPALWNYLTQAGVSQAVVAWLATWPAEAISGHLVTDRFGFLAFAGVQSEGGHEGMTWPPEYVKRARSLEVDPAELPSSFWKWFVDVPDSELEGIKQAGYSRGDLLQNLALTVTTALSSTAIAEDILRTESPRFTAVYYEMVDAAGHLLMPYAPPRSPWVPAEDFRKLGGAMDAVYELQDELLGRLLDHIDPERSVIMVLSDHGMRSGGDRPKGSAEIEGGQAARWHRDPGILVLNGFGIREGAVLTGEADLLDIAPTLLAVLGVPVPRGLPGSVLQEAFTAEGRARFAPVFADSVEFSPGVWDAPRVSASPQAQRPMQAALHNNLGLVLEAEGKLEEAAAEYRRALEADPRDKNARNNLAGILIRTGRPESARDILEPLCREEPDYVPGRFNLGVVYQAMNRWTEAESEYRAVLAAEPSHARARVNLGHTLIRMGRMAEAEAEFQSVVARLPAEANAHFGLGIVFADRGDLARARQAFQRTLELDPGHRSAAANLERLEAARP